MSCYKLVLTISNFWFLLSNKLENISHDLKICVPYIIQLSFLSKIKYKKANVSNEVKNYLYPTTKSET